MYFVHGLLYDKFFPQSFRTALCPLPQGYAPNESIRTRPRSGAETEGEAFLVPFGDMAQLRRERSCRLSTTFLASRGVERSDVKSHIKEYQVDLPLPLRDNFLSSINSLIRALMVLRLA